MVISRPWLTSCHGPHQGLRSTGILLSSAGLGLPATAQAPSPICKLQVLPASLPGRTVLYQGWGVGGNLDSWTSSRVPTVEPDGGDGSAAHSSQADPDVARNWVSARNLMGLQCVHLSPGSW